jgi:hypothetical protein
MIAGVDGYKDKWIAVTEDEAGHTAVWQPCEFRDLIDQVGLRMEIAA